LEALFFISVYSGLKCCPSLLDTTGIRVSSRNVRNSSLFTATCKSSPTARCVTAANRVCKGTDIFRKTVTSLKQILR
jgi:ornithine cyclodeaminase/alanine dehydrogenase-like protein (mu-crystallin family)